MTKEIIILGGGPAGYHSALSCHEQGMQVTLIESGRIGGLCAHYGCIPTRSYLSAIKARDQLTAANPSLAATLTLCPEELLATTQQKIDQLSFGMEYMLRKRNIRVMQDTAVISGEKQVTLSDGTVLTCDALLLATGSAPAVPATHGFQQVYAVETLLQLRPLPDAITIVGAGVLGVELAVILQAFGCKVTLAEREARILPSWDEDIAAHMSGYLQRLGIDIETNVTTPSGQCGVFCIGRRPKVPQADPSVDLSASWLHYIGDVAGGPMTADAAIRQGDIAGARLSGNPVYPAQPTVQCIFTPLEAASVGVQTPSADDLTGYMDISYAASGVLFGSDLGFVKVIMDKETRILKGVHVVSHMASELIQTAQLAIAQKMTAETFCSVVSPHPTEGELLKNLVRTMQ